MRKISVSAVLVACVVLCLAVCDVQAGSWDWLKSKVAAVSPGSNATASSGASSSSSVVADLTSKITSTKLGDTQMGAGLKEALKVGIENAIKLLGKQDGYMGNEAVKVLLPSGLKNMEPSLRRLGLGSQIDAFVLSMNRAAEKAAPLAADIFSSAIADLSFEDAQKIVNGGSTAATEHLKKATYDKLLDTFKPAVSRAMGDYEVTRKYEEILAKAKTLPMLSSFAGKLDLGSYVSSKALDGLFKVLGEQETNIRSNPAARVTDLLREVFGK